MFRVGIVKIQDPATHRVRVTFPDHDQVLSWWLPMVMAKAQDDRAYWMPEIGSQVVCFMDTQSEDGAVLGAIYSTVDTPPVNSADKAHVTFKDNAVIEYDRSAHVFQLSLPNNGRVTITANSAKIEIASNGDVNINSDGTINVDAPHVVLAGGGPDVARVGDVTVCPAGEGQITSGSTKVTAGG